MKIYIYSYMYEEYIKNYFSKITLYITKNPRTDLQTILSKHIWDSYFPHRYSPILPTQRWKACLAYQIDLFKILIETNFKLAKTYQKKNK